MNDTDQHLLERYSRQGDQAAFAEIMRRHLNLVYATALRQVRSSSLAEEVTQAVFCQLDRRARFLRSGIILPAWLWQVAHRLGLNAARNESRRRQREQIAHELSTMNEAATDWTLIEPLLDEALQALPATDCALVLLRWFEGKSMREIATTLNLREDAAQKRGSRALDRLREHFAKRGVSTSAGALAAALTAHASPEVSAQLAASLISKSLTMSVATPAGWFAALLATLFPMTKTIPAVIATTLVVVGLAVIVKFHPTPTPALVSITPTPQMSGAVNADQVKIAVNPVTAQPVTAPAKQPAVNVPVAATAKSALGSVDPQNTEQKPFDYMVEHDLDNGISETEFESSGILVGVDANGSKHYVDGMSFRFDEDHPTSSTENADGSTSVVYTRPDGSTKRVTTFKGGVVAMVVTLADKAELGKIEDDGAIANYDQDIALNPNDAHAYEGRAFAKTYHGDEEGGIADFERAIALNPNDAEIFRARSSLEMIRGDIPGQIADLDRAIALNPKNVDAYSDRARSKAFNFDYDGEIADLDRVIALKPDDMAPYERRGNAQEAKGDFLGAKADFDRVIADDDRKIAASRQDDFDFLNGERSERAEMKMTTGDYDGAIADYDWLIAQNPKDGNTYFIRGNAKQANGDFSGALADYDQVLSLDKMGSNEYTRFQHHLVVTRLRRTPDDLDQKVGDWKEGWPKTVGLFLTGKIDETELFRRAGDTQEAKAARLEFDQEMGNPARSVGTKESQIARVEAQAAREQACEANYYAGMIALLGGHPAEAREKFLACLATGVINFIEFKLAKAELARLK